MQRTTIWRAAFLGAVAVATAGIALVSITTPASAQKAMARAVLHDVNGTEVGEVIFKGDGKFADRIDVKLFAPTAPNLGKFHGFHVHATGVCNPLPSGTSNVPFGSAGGHWNPGGGNHGDHAGDMPSLLITGEGGNRSRFETDRFDVTSLLDAAGDGAAVILHIDRDNFANIPSRYTPAADATTLATGDAGGRYACGVIEEI